MPLDMTPELLEEALTKVAAWREDDEALTVPATNEARELVWAIDMLVQHAQSTKPMPSLFTANDGRPIFISYGEVVSS